MCAWPADRSWPSTGQFQSDLFFFLSVFFFHFFWWRIILISFRVSFFFQSFKRIVSWLPSSFPATPLLSTTEKKHSKNGYLTIYFPTSLGVSEWTSAAERASKVSIAEQWNESTMQANKQMNKLVTQYLCPHSWLLWTTVQQLRQETLLNYSQSFPCIIQFLLPHFLHYALMALTISLHSTRCFSRCNRFCLSVCLSLSLSLFLALSAPSSHSITLSLSLSQCCFLWNRDANSVPQIE